MSEDILVKQIINNEYNSSQLTTLLAEIENRWDFIRALNMPFYARILFEDSAALATLFGSSTAKSLILNSSVAALTVASNEVTTKNIFSTKDSAKEVMTNLTWLDSYKSYYDNYNRLKRQVNATGSKLKQAIYYGSSSTLSVSGMVAYSATVMGGGAYGYANVNNYTGQGAELGTKAGILSLTGNIAMVVGSAGSSGTSSGEETSIKYNAGANTIIAVDGGQGGPSSGNEGAGITTNGGYAQMYDKDLLAPWQFNDITQQGGSSGMIVGSTPIQGGLGGSNYIEYGKGMGSNTSYDTATGGIIVFNYIAD